MVETVSWAEMEYTIACGFCESEIRDYHPSVRVVQNRPDGSRMIFLTHEWCGEKLAEQLEAKIS